MEHLNLKTPTESRIKHTEYVQILNCCSICDNTFLNSLDFTYQKPINKFMKKRLNNKKKNILLNLQTIYFEGLKKDIYSTNYKTT